MLKQEFNFRAEDDDDVAIVCYSNKGSDKRKYLKDAKASYMKRPILVQIEGDTTSYKYTNFALTIEEAKEFSAELTRMIEYLES